MAAVNGGHPREHPDADERSLSPPNVEQSDRIKGKCDLCEKKDGFQAFKLRKCTECGVCVHETCYGLVQTAHGRPNPDWQCHACKAVGKEVVVSKPGEERETLLQEERPSDCALCPIWGESGGVHAMHPLYDTHGLAGRQVVLRAERTRNLPRRLAWVHTLCAMSTGESRLANGCVYGCLADGSYEGVEEEGDEDSETKEPVRKRPRQEGEGRNGGHQNDGSDLDSSEDEEDSRVGAVHHFVIAGLENGEETDWSRRVADCRSSLKCTLCANRNCSPLHIPIQCTRNDEKEYEEYKKRHEDSEPCFEAMHVGCARWNPTNSEYKQVFFWPGLPVHVSGPFVDPVNEVYCSLHAKEIWKNNPKREKEFAPRHQISKPTRAASRHRPAHRYEANKPGFGRTARATISRMTEAKSGPAASSSRATAQSQSKRMKPQNNGRIGTNTVSSVPSEASTMSRPFSNGTKTSSTATEPRVATSKRRDWFEVIKDDVVKVIRSAQGQGEDVQEATTRRRKHWKKEARLPKAVFKQLWVRVRVSVQNTINEMPEFREGSTDDAEKEDEDFDEAKVHRLHETDETSINPWSTLWLPNYTGGTFNFGSWDTSHESEST